jgi:hypothetical protein
MLRERDLTDALAKRFGSCTGEANSDLLMDCH